MNITVLGCGRWGSFLAWYADRVGHTVTIWGREGSKNLRELEQYRKNEYITLSDQVLVTDCLVDALASADIVIISISAQHLRAFSRQISVFPNLQNKVFVLCMKGLESTTGKRLSQVFKEEMGSSIDVAVWLGPGHVQDFTRGIPNCMVIGSENIDVTKQIVEAFNSDLIRFYYGQDMIGNEIGAATKNVMGIAAGMLDGLGYTSLKGALMARGTREISRLVRAMGGNDITIYGLSHLGDYEATLFSPYSHNRRFGEEFVKGSKSDKLAEGVATITALHQLSQTYNIDLPICNALYQIITQQEIPSDVLIDLFLRPIKFEF